MNEQNKTPAPEKPVLNMRYYNKGVDDDLPTEGVLKVDPGTGPIYAEDGDVVGEETLATFCGGDGKGDDENE